jgi:hypothetical protein
LADAGAVRRSTPPPLLLPLHGPEPRRVFRRENKILLKPIESLSFDLVTGGWPSTCRMKLGGI